MDLKMFPATESEALAFAYATAHVSDAASPEEFYELYHDACEKVAAARKAARADRGTQKVDY